MNKEEIRKRITEFHDYLLRCHNFVSDREITSYEERIFTRGELIVYEEMVEMIEAILNERLA